MRILLVRRGSIENLDGISSYILELARNLSRRGHDVRLMCGYLNRRDYRPLEGVPPVIPGPNSALPIAWTRELRKVVAEFRPDIIHANNAILCYLRRTPMVLTYHGIEALALNAAFRRLRALFQIYLTASFLNYEKIIVASSKVRDELSKLLILPQARKKLVIIPIGVDLTRYQKHIKKLPEREVAALHMGTRMQKNLRCTIQALRLIWKDGIKATLYVTGPDTPYLRYCMNNLNAQERMFVKYVGFLQKNNLSELIGRVRLYILPSYYEGFSIATLESICCGTPVIVSDAIPKELVKHGVNGFRVKDPDDFRTFAQHAKALLLDDDLWEKMSNACLKSSRLYDVNLMVNKILTLYKSCIER